MKLLSDDGVRHRPGKASFWRPWENRNALEPPGASKDIAASRFVARQKDTAAAAAAPRILLSGTSLCLLDAKAWGSNRPQIPPMGGP